MKKKYIKHYKYIDGKIYDGKNNIVKNKNLNDIINKYNPPKHLHNIEIIASTIDEADNGIIYIGLDNKQKKQYIYGINYIKRRRNNRINIFLNVENKIPKIEKYINKYLNIAANDTNKITDKTIFSIILLIEMCFFIRTGKKKYLDDNETIGLLTLQKSNFIIDTDKIDIIFKGKLNQQQKFTIYKNSHPIIYKYIKILYDNTNNFIFKDDKGTIFTESKLYQMMKIFKLKLKDIRTFGVNRVLINELWKNVKDLNNIHDIRHKHIKKIISEIIKRTANIIGHTPTISKNSYILDELRNIIDKETIFKATIMDFISFYKYIVDRLKNFNISQC
jgi:DNA topoisomerase IB